MESQKAPIDGVVTVSEVISRGNQSPEVGLSHPWEAISEIMYGQRFSECTVLAGGVGIGKTTTFHELIAHNIKEHKVPCFVAMLEESNIATCRNVAGIMDSLMYKKPQVFQENLERYNETVRSMEDKLFLWNSDGHSSYRFDLKGILDAIRFNNAEYGCRFAFIDNMTRIVDGMSTSEANEFINKYSSEIANLCAELDIHIYLASHLNPPKGRDAVPHEAGGEVHLSQLTGSRGIMRTFPNAIGFERNKYAEGDKANNSYLAVLKNREYGNEQKIKTRYDPNTGRLQEYNWEGDSLQED